MNCRTEDWTTFRGEVLSHMDKIREDALKHFMDIIGIKDTFAYDYSSSENKLTIYTSKPGIWIGLHGKNVEILKDILSKEINDGCDVEFKEIHGKFMVME